MSLFNLGLIIETKLPFIHQLVSKITVNLTTHATSLHVRSEELLSTVLEIGGLLHSNV